MKNKIFNKNLKYIFGPVYSWRLGISLGIDPLSRAAKVCSFDCVYCQLGKTAIVCKRRKIFIPTKEIIEEIKNMPARGVDYITFSGRGEPTLARNLGQMIKAVRQLRKDKIAVITNASLLTRRDVRQDLKVADFVLVKLDAFDQKSLVSINRPGKMNFHRILSGIKRFKKSYRGKLGLQIMFIAGNKGNARQIAEMAKAIEPDEIQLNTPLRKSPAAPLSKTEMKRIKSVFKGFKLKMVYDYPHKDIKPIDKDNMIKRHGMAG